MNKILIINNNLAVGGIQRSLINLLREIHNEYDVTLLLFSRSGVLLNEVPEKVKIITPQRQYRMLGLTREELKKYPLLFVLKAFLLKYTKLFSRRSAMRLLGIFQKKITGYDTVISYTHLSRHKSFWNGCGDFVLDKTESENKICMIHCDYLNSGCMSHKSNYEYAEFDKIVCCSDSVKSSFLQGSGIDPSKVHTLRNFYDLSIKCLAKQEPYCYDKKYINVVTVARLSPEKGIDRAIEALYKSNRLDIRYYIVGDGPQKAALLDITSKYNMTSQIFFVGEQQNPYRYMLNADYLLVPSLHEAAPMVFDEAQVLGLKVVSTNTTSALEMIGDNGIICENSIAGIERVLSELTKRTEKKNFSKTNQLQKKQFAQIVG